MYQNWGKLLFLHWSFEPDLIRPLVPDLLELDLFEGRAYVGVTPFTMWGVRLRGLPPLPPVSAFHELNVRTYVRRGGISGIFFFSLDAASAVASLWARLGFGLPYYPARMSLTEEDGRIQYASERLMRPHARFSATWHVGEPLGYAPAGSLPHFLTERYVLFTVRLGMAIRAHVDHPPWTLFQAQLDELESTMLIASGISETGVGPIVHYGADQPVSVWRPQRA